MKNKQTAEILNITFTPLSRQEILEDITQHLQKPSGFYHILSLNPENVVVATQNDEFFRVVQAASLKIVDGVGVQWALRTGGVTGMERVTGVDLMELIMGQAVTLRLRTMIIGASQDLAAELAKCQNKKAGAELFFGEQGFENISQPTEEEKTALFSRITELKPHIIFAAFGSPAQELWFWRNRARFDGILCMGVGGSVDFLTGHVSRAPQTMRKLGLEWLYRLIRQPWRITRQQRLLTFIGLILRHRPRIISSS